MMFYWCYCCCWLITVETYWVLCYYHGCFWPYAYCCCCYPVEVETGYAGRMACWLLPGVVYLLNGDGVLTTLSSTGWRVEIWGGAYCCWGGSDFTGEASDFTYYWLSWGSGTCSFSSSIYGRYSWMTYYYTGSSEETTSSKTVPMTSSSGTYMSDWGKTEASLGYY